MTRAEQDGAQWHVVYIRSKEEARARDLLKRRRFEVYYPQMRTSQTPPLRKMSPSQRRHARWLAREILKPLFPRYHFVRFDRGRDAWHEAFRLAGVLGMVCEGGRIMMVPESEILRIKGLEVDGAVPGSLPVSQFVPGGRAQLDDDSLISGQVGTIEEVHDDGRVSLLLSMFGRLVRYQTTINELWPVTA